MHSELVIFLVLLVGSKLFRFLDTVAQIFWAYHQRSPAFYYSKIIRSFRMCILQACIAAFAMYRNLILSTTNEEEI